MPSTLGHTRLARRHLSLARMARVPRDVAIHLFRRTPEGIRFLMLRRRPERGGFWQGVTGAPLPGESDVEAAIREVREETGYDVRERLRELGTRYDHAVRPETAERWASLYGPGVTSIPVVTFGAEVAAPSSPVLDPVEHDDFAWCTYEAAYALLDWPVETDALPGRRHALTELLGLIDRR
jgi:8-oxo-dGTP pyrophosphatase MutT (NUDIX family)